MQIYFPQTLLPVSLSSAMFATPAYAESNCLANRGVGKPLEKRRPHACRRGLFAPFHTPRQSDIDGNDSIHTDLSQALLWCCIFLKITCLWTGGLDGIVGGQRC